MKKLILLLAILPLTACFDGDKSQSKNKVATGTFKAIFGETKYDFPIACRNFDSGDFDTQFAFFSDADKAGNIDSNGDGIMLHGSRIKVGKGKSPIPLDGISFGITDQGVRYENNLGVYGMTKTKQDWTLNANGISGTDVLYKNDDSSLKKYPISYEVFCN